MEHSDQPPPPTPGDSVAVEGPRERNLRIGAAAMAFLLLMLAVFLSNHAATTGGIDADNSAVFATRTLAVSVGGFVAAALGGWLLRAWSVLVVYPFAAYPAVVVVWWLELPIGVEVFGGLVAALGFVAAILLRRFRPVWPAIGFGMVVAGLLTITLRALPSPGPVYNEVFAGGADLVLEEAGLPVLGRSHYVIPLGNSGYLYADDLVVVDVSAVCEEPTFACMEGWLAAQDWCRDVERRDDYLGFQVWVGAGDVFASARPSSEAPWLWGDDDPNPGTAPQHWVIRFGG